MASENVQKRIEMLLDEAKDAAAESDWAMVLNCAQSIRRMDSENGDARAYLAATERALGMQSMSSDDLQDC